MTEDDCKRVNDIAKRIGDVVRFLEENDAENLSDEDVESLKLILGNISKVLTDMSLEPTQ